VISFPEISLQYMTSLLVNAQRFTFFSFLVLRFSGTNIFFPPTVLASLVVSMLQMNYQLFWQGFFFLICLGKHNFSQLSVKSKITQLPFCCGWHSF